MTTPRSRSSSPASIFGRPTKSVRRSIASIADSARTVMWKATRSWLRWGFRTPPLPPADPLGRLVDLAIVVVELAALEDEVLEEVRHAVLLRPLRAGAGVEGDED